jgi:F0F1-type ATP synthase alpha subunit
MSAPSHKFSDFVDLVLVRLYEMDQVDSDSFVDLSSVQREIIGNVPASWLLDAAKVLQARSLADCMINSSGVFAHISGEGRLYVENRQGKTGEIEDKRSNYYITVSGSNNQVVAGQTIGSTTQTISVDQSGGPWGHLVDTIEEKVKNDASLGHEDKEQALSYVKVVRGELRKREPNRSVVAAVLEPLSQIISVASQVANLIKVFNG